MQKFFEISQCFTDERLFMSSTGKTESVQELKTKFFDLLFH